MAITFVNAGTFAEANSTSSGAVGLPASLATSDILVLQVLARGTASTIDTPAGYTQAATVNRTNSHRMSVFYKVCTNAGTEAAPTVTQTVSNLIAARLTAWRGCDTTTPLDVTTVTDDGASATTYDVPSITPVSTGAMGIWCASTPDDNSLGSASQGTTAYASQSTLGSDGSIALVYELQTTAAATGVCNLTQGANGPDNWNGITLALRPAAVAAANPSRDIGFDSITYALEMAFGSSPFAPNPTWTDIGAYVRASDGITVTRGRTTEFSDTQPGTMSFTLDNRTRLFDPDYASGTYFGQLVPMVRCRLRVRQSSVNYPIFDGYVQSWDQAYSYPREAVAQVQCVDLFSRLATRRMPETLYQAVVIGDDPYGYWPLDDGADSLTGTAPDLSGDGRDGQFANATSIDSFIPGEAGRKAKSMVGLDLGFIYTNSLAASGSPPSLARTMELWFNVDTYSTSASYVDVPQFQAKGYGESNAYAFFIINSSDTAFGFSLEPVLYDAVGGNSGALLIPIQTDKLYHLVLTLNTAGTILSYYLNGALQITADVSALTFEGGSNTGVATMETLPTATVKVAHFATYEATLTAAEILEHYSVGMSGGLMQTVGDRADAIAGYIGLDDAGLYDSSDVQDNTYLGYGRFSGNAQTALQSLITTEQGRMFVDAAGILQLQGRTADMKAVTANATVQATLSDSGSYAYADLHIQPGTTELLRNAEYIGLSEGATVVANDPTSVTLYDEQQESIQSELVDPTAARNLGLSRLRRFKNPTSRIDQVTLIPHGTADVRYPLVFTVDLGWRLTVTRTPQAVGSAISKTVTVEGITHQITGATWTTTLYLVPAQTAYTAQPWFTLGDATYGRLGAAAGNQLPY